MSSRQVQMYGITQLNNEIRWRAVSDTLDMTALAAHGSRRYPKVSVDLIQALEQNLNVFFFALIGDERRPTTTKSSTRSCGSGGIGIGSCTNSSKKTFGGRDNAISNASPKLGGFHR